MMNHSMNNQELLDKAVHECKGVWPAERYGCEYMESYLSKDTWKAASSPFAKNIVFSKSEFQQRARELGYVNGFRWGVEYPTNGKKPDLADDLWVTVQLTTALKEIYFGDRAKCVNFWRFSESFKITDQRYKPADTSYLDAPKAEQVEPDSWYCYESQKALWLPPVGVECEVRYARLTDWCKALVLDNDTFAYYENEHWEVMGLSSKIQFRPLDWNRKAEAEHKRVVDAAYQLHYKCVDYEDFVEKLYEEGMLVMPSKSSQD